MNGIKKLIVIGLVVGGLAALGPAFARAEDGVDQATKGPAMFELKMRILGGDREGPDQPAKPVTASFLKFQKLINFDTPEDVQLEQQIKKLYNLNELSLVTETPLVWEKGKTEKALHMFRLNGQDYQVAVTPSRPADKNKFRIEVLEKFAGKASNLLDTEFTLPDKSAAVFGFENTQAKPYFITLRLTGLVGTAGGPGAQPAGREGVSGGRDEKVMPPKLVKKVDPVYPEVARKARVEGAVILEATTDTYGRVANIKVLRSIPLLDQAAIDALRQWIYEPMIVDGKPQPVTYTVTIQFRFDDKKKPEVGGVVGGVIGGVQGGVEGGVKGGVQGGVEGGVKGGVAGGVEGAQAQAEDIKAFEKNAVRAVGDIQPPQLLKEVAPVYPEIARKSGVQGMVILEVKSDEQGTIVGVRLLRSIPLLDQAAIEAVKQWKYEPLVIDGKPRQVIFTVTVNFKLEDGSEEKTLEKFAQGAVKAEGEVQPPEQTKYVKPSYPEAARQAGVQGTVILGVKADEAGRVVDVVVLRSIPLLDQAAIDAAKQWAYEPKIIDGKAVPIVFTITVRFVLR